MDVISRARVRGWTVVQAVAALAIAHGAARINRRASALRRLAMPKAQYLAKPSALGTHGEVKVVYDPLFRNDFGRSPRLPTGTTS